MIRNSRGAGILVYLMAMSVVSALFFASIQSYLMGLDKVKNSYRFYAERRQLANELKVIIGNQSLCTNLLHIDGSSFRLGSVLPAGPQIITVKQKYENVLEVQDLAVENLRTVKDNPKKSYIKKSADFSVYFKQVENTVVNGLMRVNDTEKVTVSAGFNVDRNTNTISSCHLFIGPKETCADAGGRWDSNLNFCDFCSRIGGTWQGNSPDDPVPGYCYVKRAT